MFYTYPVCITHVTFKYIAYIYHILNTHNTMAKKPKKEEAPLTTKVVPTVPECGPTPTRPGSDKPGDWSCREGKWVWVENIGG